jgi:hypothetical protein
MIDEIGSGCAAVPRILTPHLDQGAFPDLPSVLMESTGQADLKVQIGTSPSACWRNGQRQKGRFLAVDVELVQERGRHITDGYEPSRSIAIGHLPFSHLTSVLSEGDVAERVMRHG